LRGQRRGAAGAQGDPRQRHRAGHGVDADGREPRPRDARAPPTRQPARRGQRLGRRLGRRLSRQRRGALGHGPDAGDRRRLDADYAMTAGDIVTKRVYEPAAPEDGDRVLIMRLWPRGIRKERVSVWLKELGPVPALLRQFLDAKITWKQYVPRYLAGLERPEAQEAIEDVRRRARGGRVTLLCGCADAER